ncbi:hypothetical protein C5O27_02660 [Gordonia alkanivorans]|uniref:C39 family peptidase n=1 Tax=Gordonia alkanivorans TaxID=84096 RepID=UPI000FDDAAF2|nr:C39 family peptidase [Gordonia alkanivorans]AZZ80130.1 hypothetical protein C5O27_02660 [Gordonia alkanivorans]
MSDFIDSSTDDTDDAAHDADTAIDPLASAQFGSSADTAIPFFDDESAVFESPAGAREEFSPHWFEQAANGTCVPASVAQIVSEYTGTEFANEGVFVQYAYEQGFYTDGKVENGMTAEQGAAILNAAGIPATVAEGDLESLETLLEAGHGVMLAVDSGDYWSPGQEVVDELTGVDIGADHCVVVTEIDENSGVVYLSDTGTPDGNQLAVPLYQFEQAWAESANTMVVCDDPSPNTGSATDDSTDPEFIPGEYTTTLAPDDEYAYTDAASSTSVVDATTGLPSTSAAGAGPSITSDLAATIDWATARPWVMLPVTLTIGAIAGAQVSSRR